jgi:hypothetical protein
MRYGCVAVTLSLLPPDPESLPVMVIAAVNPEVGLVGFRMLCWEKYDPL